MKKVLVVEDEAAIREFVVINLKRGGYDVVECGSGEEALALYHQHDGDFQIALLDVMLPGIDGLTVCREIRALDSTIGIIMLTARAQEMDKISGLMLGADDYVTKPFSPSELVARVDSLQRRVDMLSAQNPKVRLSEILQQGEFTLDIRRRTMTKSGENIELTQVEFQLMEFFFRHPNVSLDRTDILRNVCGEAYIGEEKIVDVNVRRLRMKVEEEPSLPTHLITVWGTGYKWVAQN